MHLINVSYFTVFVSQFPATMVPRTPPTNRTYHSDPLPTLTPLKFTDIKRRDAALQGLQIQREMLKESTRNQTIEVPTFGQTYLRLLAEEDLANLIDHVMDTMVAQKQWSVEQGWSATQKISGVGEDDTYAGLAAIADSIHEACVSWDKDVHKLGPRTTTSLCEPRLTTYSEVSGGSMITDTRSLRVSSSTPKDRRPDTAPTVRSSTLNAPFVGDRPQRFTSDVTSVGEVKLSEEDRAEVSVVQSYLDTGT